MVHSKHKLKKTKTKTKNKTKKRGGLFQFVQNPKKNKNTKTKSNNTLIASKGQLYPNSLNMLVSTSRALIKTVDIVIKGTLAVVSGIFYLLKIAFQQLPAEFDEVVHALSETTNFVDKKILFKRLLQIFQNITNTTERLFAQLFKQHANLNSQLISEIRFQLENAGCSRTLLNRAFRGSMAYSSCNNTFTGNKKNIDKVIARLQRTLVKIKDDLKAESNTLNSINETYYEKLKLLSNIYDDELLLEFMPSYLLVVRPILDTSKKVFSKENPDIVIGYNIFGFDYQFMFYRAEETNCIEEFLKLSRNKDEICATRDN